MNYADKSLPKTGSEYRKPRERLAGRPGQKQIQDNKKPKIRLPIYNEHNLLQEATVMPVQFFEKPKLNTHSKALINAVLDQAFDDLSGELVGEGNERSTTKQDKLRVTRDWFLSDDVWCNGFGFSFAFICQHLEYDISVFRRRALELYAQHPLSLSAAARAEQERHKAEARHKLAFVCYVNTRVDKGRWRTFLVSDGPEAYFVTLTR
jgi:hypothetical protein